MSPPKIRVSADRGGTFTDVHAAWDGDDGEEKEFIVKLLSKDPSNYRDAPTEGIRRVLEHVTGQKIDRDRRLPTDNIEYIRLSTTVATNALLERKGHKHALVVTKGFRDVLLIGNQSRPKIFDLNIRRPEPLFSDVLEVDERVTLVGFTSDPKYSENALQFNDDGSVRRRYQGAGWDGEGNAEGHGDIVRGLSDEAVRVMQKPDLDVVRTNLQSLYDSGFRSLAICFVHSYTYPNHEKAVADVARSIGFSHLSVSSSLLPMIKLVPRGVSATADAYLTPILFDYLHGFFEGFEDTDVIRQRVEFMGSDGGLLNLEHFSGLKSILSGPAGGVVGCALTSWDEARRQPVLGLDIGGTSTDVSRFDGRYEVVYETTTAGVTIQSPQLDINTVAAGGGSCLTFSNGLFRVGPHSAGADPGPVCYRKGGALAITDANLILGRLLPDFFPKIFGKKENESLDVHSARAELEKLAQQIGDAFEKKLSFDELVYGFIRVANETICRPIRALTEARGYATSKHVLSSFGGAGGQHACEIAKELGIKTVLIHRYSSILSAYGLALADRAFELQEPTSTPYEDSTRPSLISKLDKLSSDVRTELKKQGFEESRMQIERMLNMRFDGTDTALMIASEGDFEADFKTEYKKEFGFLLEKNKIVVDDVKVRGLGKTFDSLGETVFAEMEKLETRDVRNDSDKVATRHDVYFADVGRVKDTPVFKLDALEIGDRISGPAVVLDDTQTIVIIPNSNAVVTRKHLYITVE